MTVSPDTDKFRAAQGAQPALPFAKDELATNGPRLRPSELARLLGVSRQSVSEWIKAGKVKLGSDGRLDPRKAVADVLRAGDPARLRARVLAPLAAEIAALRARVAHLTHELAVCEEDRQFHEGAGSEMAEQIIKLESLVPSLPGIDGPARAALMAVINMYGSEWGTQPGDAGLPVLDKAELDDMAALADAELDGLPGVIEAPEAAPVLASMR